MGTTILSNGRPTRFSAGRTATRHIERATASKPPVDAVRARDLADSAETLLGSTAFEHVMEELRGAAYFDLMNSEPGPAGETQRTVAHFKLTILDQLDKKLRAMIEDAKFAVAQEADEAAAENA